MAGTLYHDIEVEDVSMAMVRFENGAMGSITNSVLSPREESYLRFDFEKATVELSHLYGYGPDNWKYTKAPRRSPGVCPLERRARAKARRAHGPDRRALGQHGQGRATSVGAAAPKPGGRPIEFITALYKAAFHRGPLYAGARSRPTTPSTT